jgi:hypothetical protein
LNADDGSALILMPAAVLIVLALSAITMDLSLVHLARREAIAAAEAAADDAVTFGLDERMLRLNGRYVLSEARVHDAVDRALMARSIDDELAAPPTVTITGTTVEVRVELQVDYVFAPALPGAPRGTTVSAVGSADPVAR